MSSGLKIISNMAAGYDNIDVNSATAKGIMVTNTPDVLTETTADLAFALILATSRRLLEAEKFLRNGDWVTWEPMLLTGQDVYGATMGIIGLGRIGSASVATRTKMAFVAARNLIAGLTGKIPPDLVNPEVIK